MSANVDGNARTLIPRICLRDTNVRPLVLDTVLYTFRFENMNSLLRYISVKRTLRQISSATRRRRISRLARESARITKNESPIGHARVPSFFSLASHFALLLASLTEDTGTDLSSHAAAHATAFHRTNTPSSGRKTLSFATRIYWLERIDPFDAHLAVHSRASPSAFREIFRRK